MNNNKGLSLIELMIGIGILSLNILGSVHLQSLSTKSKSQGDNLGAIAEKGREIQKLLNNKQACTQNFTGLAPDATLENLVSNGVNIPREISNTVNIQEYRIVEANNGFSYLQVTYQSQQTNGAPRILTRRYPILARRDAGGNLLDCYQAETSDLDLVTENLVCERNGGQMDANSQCDILNRDLDGTPPEGVEECGRGATFKMVYEDGAPKLKCQPCTLKKKLIRSACEKGPSINIPGFVMDEDGEKGSGGIKGVNWVNVCYYRSYCEEDPDGRVFGKTYFQLGKMNASGNDTGTKNNCEKKRLPCEGAETTTQNAGAIATAQSISARDSLDAAITQVRLIEKYIFQDRLDSAYNVFGDLKKSTDAAAYAAHQARITATDYPSAEANKAAREAEQYSKDALGQFQKGARILEENGAFRGLAQQ